MDEDPREVELSTITAIYPELQINEDDRYKLFIELPVTLYNPLTVLFPAATETAPPLAPSQAPVLPPGPEVGGRADSQDLLNLPALRVDITLPEGYPQLKPPEISLTTSPPWLSNEVLRRLESNATRLWEEIGRDQVIFTYIDDLQRASEDVFGLVDSNGTLEVAPEHKIALLDYDINAKRKAFEKETFECSICLDPKKGIVCHKMLDCGHVFCVKCLQDFYNNAIAEGDVGSVTCLAPNCKKEREKNAEDELSPGRRKPKTFISPSELLQIPIEQGMVQRYVHLTHKNKLESDKNTIYCPRSWCQGAARSKRHKKPEGLELADSDDEEDEDTGLLAICEDCGFAFCSRCSQSWHGEFQYCLPKERKEAITEEELASLEYLKLHSTPCPTCGAPCQKSHGCNHMQCYRCKTHFCYLCSAWLDPSNPYKHFNTVPSGQANSCYMRLWELEGGDGDDVGIGFEGGDAMRNANVVAGQYGEHLEIVEQPRVAPRAPENDANGEVQQNLPLEQANAEAQGRQQPVPAQVAHPERRPAVAREGPLVLRIEGLAGQARGRGGQRQREVGGAHPAEPPVAGARANGGHRGGRGGNRRGRGGAAPNQANANRNPAQRPGRANNHHNNNNNNGVRGVQHPPPGMGAVPRPNGGLPRDDEDDDVNPMHAAWIRHFVQLALNDEEHLIDWGNDED
ncbi:RWD-domain-containing protein [Poronia punctata]|nr:RWD-domain-containing protein [Poronia punctata]